MSTSRHADLLCLAALAGACLNGCVAEVQGVGHEEVEESAASLAVRIGTGLWPDGHIPVCFHPRSVGDDWPLYDQFTARFRWLAETWYETISDAEIDFHGWEICSNAGDVVGDLPGQLRVIVNPDDVGVWTFRHCPANVPVNQSQCSGGSGYTGSLESDIYLKGLGYSWGSHWDTAALHELMHALGTGHEQSRTDNTEQATCPGNEANPITGTFLTTYDPLSISAGTYCDKWPGELSRHDALGLEMTYYSGDFTHDLRSNASLRTSTGIVVRGDDLLQTEWTLRGAHADAFPEGVRWTVNGATLDSLWYWTGFLPAGTSTPVSATFEDFRGRAHTIPTTQVRVDRRLHTALVVAVL